MKQMFIWLVVFIVTARLFALQTSSESVNPFNQFMAPSGGCDLYSGNAAFSIPLISLQGYNSTDVQVALSYSSNVTVNSRSMNKNGPTSWVGLGWSLQFGSIRCDHKGTTTHDDDEFYYVAGAGNVNRLIRPDRLKYRLCSNYQHGTLDSINSDSVKFDESGSCSWFNCRRTKENYRYALIFEGKLLLHVGGEYWFHVRSDDGCRLYIDDTLVVDCDGIKPYNSTEAEKNGKTGFKAAGYHNIKVEYFQADGDRGLSIEYTPPNGTRQPIPIEDLRHPDIPAVDLDKKFYVENTPWLKCEPIDFNGDKVYDCWQITNTDGTIMIFGKSGSNDTSKSAVRYTFSRNSVVGAVTIGNPSLYPYQWDLRAVINNFGDTVKYWYQKEDCAVVTDDFDSRSLNLYYTKASYPDSIVNSSGKSLKFVLEDKKNGTLVEPYDPYIYHAEPDGFMEMYESKRLKRVHVYSPEIVTPVKTIELDYQFLNQNLGNSFVKSMLKSIEWRNNLAGAVENRYDFQYYDDSTQSGDSIQGGYNPDYHYGAIKNIKDYHGTVTEYSYTQISQNDSTYNHYGPAGKIGDVVIKNGYLKLYRNVLDSNVGPWVHGDDGIQVYGGSYDNGKEFIVIHGGRSKDRLWLYTFDGHTWILDSVFNCIGFHNTDPKSVVAFDNGILYTKTGTTNNDALIIFWYNGKWHLNNIATAHQDNHVVNVCLGNDFLVIVGGDGDHDEDRIWVYRRYQGEWIHDAQLFEIKVHNSQENLKVATGNNFFVVTEDNSKKSCVYRWNGNVWVRKDLLPNNSSEPYRITYACNNYFVITGGSKDDYLWLYYWNGDSLKETRYNCTLLGNKGNDLTVYTSYDYFVVKEKDTTQKNIWIISWNGKDWIEQKSENLTGGEHYINVFPGPDFIAIRGGDAEVYDRFRLYRKQNHTLNNAQDSIWVKDINWEHLKKEDGTDVGDEFSAVAGNNSFAITTTGKKSPQGKMYRWIYRFDGSGWKKIHYNTANSLPEHNDKDNKLRYSLCSTNGGYGFATTSYVDDHNLHPQQITIEFVHKFQDNFNSIKSYVVSRKDVISLSTAETLTTTFEYDSSYFDAYIGSLKFNKVSVITENNGKTTNYFYNDGDYYTARPDYKELDGLVYKTETRNENNQLLSSQMSFHKLFRKEHWPYGIHEKRSDTTLSCNTGVYDTTCILDYKYGAPSLTAKIMNTHNTQVQGIIFAHEIDTAMKNRYMLTQQYQSFVYEKEKGQNLLTPQSSDYRSSQVNLWRKQPKYGFFAPCSSFVWNASCDASGNPAPGQFYQFDHNASASYNINRNWDYTGSVKKYNRHGIPLEKEDKSGKLSATITSTSREIPIGSADNCSYQELGVFTCDYKTGNSTDWWDSLQGWKKYTNALLVNDSVHFGQRSVKFTHRYAVCRDNQIIPGKSYIMSAWVKVNSGLVLMKTDFRHSTLNDQDVWPLRTLQLADSLGTIADSLNSTDCAGKWKLMKIEIPVSVTSRMNPSYDWYARAWIGEPEHLTGSVCAYVDDVRFYPKNAHVTTTYYDTLYYQPIITIDENNNPGMLVKYDLQGRPEEWYKINKHEPMQKTLVMKKEYHLFEQALNP